MFSTPVQPSTSSGETNTKIRFCFEKRDNIVLTKYQILLSQQPKVYSEWLYIAQQYQELIPHHQVLKSRIDASRTFTSKLNAMAHFQNLAMNLTRDEAQPYVNKTFVGRVEHLSNENSQESISESIFEPSIEMQEEQQTMFVNVLNAVQLIGPNAAAIFADSWKYLGGAFIDYYNEKQQLIKIGYKTIDEQSLIRKVIIGFPENIRNQISVYNPQSGSELKAALVLFEVYSIGTKSCL